ncbi:MAG: NUDIX domain-containing protein [Chitinophagales bacterium]
MAKKQMQKLASGSAALNPHVSVDCVIFGYDGQDLKVLLIERDPASTRGAHWALPGNLVRDDEDLDQSAQRILNELTGLNNIYLEQLYAFGDPSRVRRDEDAAWLQQMRAEPQARVITVAYFALIKLENLVLRPDSFARKSEWYPLNKIPKLAFDHNDILAKAVQTLKRRTHHTPIGFELLPRKFTLGQLQKLYEAILGDELDKRNFRRKMKKLNILQPLAEKQRDVAHKPAQLYRFNARIYAQLVEGII